MSTATITAPPVPARTSSGSGLSAPGVIRSEWIKLRSLRSTIWSYAIVVIVSLGMAFLLSSTLGNSDFGPLIDSPERTLLQAATFGTTFGVLVVAVLGVLVISGEYTTGMARSTFTAVPKRLGALAAKAVVLFVSTFVVGLISSVASGALAFFVLASNGVHPEITGEVVTGVLLASLYLAAVSLFALGLGTILRSSAGGIAAALGVLLLLPTILMVFASVTQAEWAANLIPYLLVNAGEAMILPSADGLALWESALTVGLWAAVPLAIGAVLLKRRDV
ncbi:ABC transporter permease [Glaciihabitans arcticus]|uniref:ABC transporter permease n=1 Tax=Glaciihabitans arcticus TaxID=2668039 RepID=A0A4Q9GQF5_9MICO|nr:ABC transporter permease subunit [Glaciihabitans arcticus]TBN57102.1 ABC transporter permease [Glaciihabitans arcticus]